MTPSKRVMDLALAVLIGIAMAPVLLVIAILILIMDGPPLFHISERMKTPTQSFRLVKFRTMRPVSEDSGVSGGDKTDRVTRLGHFLRRTRLDEVPQLWNVLKGDISFVGPRPPLRQYVEQFPELYAQVLRSRPGITGLASLHFHMHEERLLARSRSAAETDSIYRRACIPRKARLDLIYQAHQDACLDLAIMLKTVWRRGR